MSDRKEPTTQTAFRMPASLLARLDAFVEKLNRENPGMGATRASAHRILLTRALDAEDAREASENKARGGRR